MAASVDPTGGGETAAHPGFVVARVFRNGASPREYLRSFAVAGRNGVAQLGFGPRDAARLFDRRAEAEDVARRLRRRTTLVAYDYLVEEADRNTAAVGQSPGLASDVATS